VSRGPGAPLPRPPGAAAATLPVDAVRTVWLDDPATQAAIQAQVTSKANADKAQQEALEAKARGEYVNPRSVRDLGALPLPACGESVGVRGVL